VALRRRAWEAQRVLFVFALFCGSAAIALWIDVRFPSIAPASLIWRGLGALLFCRLVTTLPLGYGSHVAVYAIVFGVLLPLLVAMWLHAVWLLRAMRDLLTG
jgi:hypothetical protein